MLLSEALHRWTACLGVHAPGPCRLAVGDGWLLLGLLLGVVCAVYIGRKLVTALLTLRAMALTPALARRLSQWVKACDYAEEEFVRADGAREPWIELRHKALDRLAMFFQAQYAQSIAWGKAIRES